MKAELAKLLRASLVEHREWRHNAMAHLREAVTVLGEVVAEATHDGMRVDFADTLPATMPAAGPAPRQPRKGVVAYVYLDGPSNTLASLPPEVEWWRPSSDRGQVVLFVLTSVDEAAEYPLRAYPTVAEYRNDGPAFELWSTQRDMRNGFRRLAATPRSPLVQAMAEYDVEQEILDE